MAAKKTAAVVVTHNRLDLLKRCLEGVRAQSTCPESIVVVNNASSDGTSEWLEKQGGLEVIIQENLGSAGGQAAGIERAKGIGASFFWLMDDDGCPDRRCLEELLTVRERLDLDVVGPVVYEASLDECFRFIPKGRGREYLTERASTVIRLFPAYFPFGASAFHGLLVPDYVISKAGSVRKDMFIWGEDYEFIHRIASVGFKCGVVTTAFFRHPKSSSRPIQLWGGRAGHLMDAPENMIFYQIRNRVYIDKVYFSTWKAVDFSVRTACKYLIHAICTRRCGRLRQVIRAIHRGWREDFSDS